MDLPRIALFGGAFNPIHEGHLALARFLTHRLSLARIVFVPTGRPPHRSLPDDPGCLHRLRMVEQVIQPHPEWEVSDFECASPDVSYTWRTVEVLFPLESPWLVLGADAFEGLYSWFGVEPLLERVHLLIVARPGTTESGIRLACQRLVPFGFPDLPAFLDRSGYEGKNWSLSLTRIPRKSGEKLLAFVHAGTPDISSTSVRESLSHWSRGGEPPGNILPAMVKSYIVEKGLYGISFRNKQ
ncbi:MAG: nicotinate (nicotinamide) nucleotide adenylyltransferase [Leptospirales bacterium]